jgi:hypothetical protein
MKRRSGVRVGPRSTKNRGFRSPSMPFESVTERPIRKSTRGTRPRHASIRTVSTRVKTQAIAVACGRHDSGRCRVCEAGRASRRPKAKSRKLTPVKASWLPVLEAVLARRNPDSTDSGSGSTRMGGGDESPTRGAFKGQRRLSAFCFRPSVCLSNIRELSDRLRSHHMGTPAAPAGPNEMSGVGHRVHPDCRCRRGAGHLELAGVGGTRPHFDLPPGVAAVVGHRDR